MMQPPKSPPPPPEFGLLWLIALFIFCLAFRPAPGVPVAPATIALTPPRFVALSAGEAAAASRLLGSVAAEAMAELGEDCR